MSEILNWWKSLFRKKLEAQNRQSKVKKTYLFLSNAFWSVIYTGFYMFGKNLLFKQG